MLSTRPTSTTCSERGKKHFLAGPASLLLLGFQLLGCGSSSSPVGSTSVTLLISSTANDKLSMFQMEILDLTLTSQSGSKVSLLALPALPASPEYTEFMHVNGIAEPLATVSVPQGVYTGATLTFGDAEFTCELNPSTGDGTDTAVIGGFGLPSSMVPVVNLPTPITITGSAMGLSLDLQVSESIQFSSCPSLGVGAYTFTPTFDLTPVTLASQPSNVGNGKVTGLTGFLASINTTANSFTVTAADGPIWSVYLSGSTVFQGITGPSALVAGMPVTMDAAVQADGALLATRVEVDDTNPTDLSVTSGQLTGIITSGLMAAPGPQPALWFVSTLDQGFAYSIGFAIGSRPYTYYSPNAIFQTSGQLANLKNLPFTASFTAANMVPGQNVSVTMHTSSPYVPFPPLTTVTLIPQVLDGTVSAVSSQGGFTTYTVALAPYDLLPELAVQTGQTTLINNPGTVVVYVDSNTQLLNSGTIGVGSVMRFNGLVFNDNGTLRMDCAQVNDGVAE